MSRATSSVPRTQKAQELAQTRTDAMHLIDWHFEGLPIDRRSCEQCNIPQGAHGVAHGRC